LSQAEIPGRWCRPGAAWQKAPQKPDKLAAVLEMWQGRLKWWSTEFEYPKDFKYRPSKNDKPGQGEPSGGEAPEAPPPTADGDRPPAEPVPDEQPAEEPEAEDAAEAAPDEPAPEGPATGGRPARRPSPGPIAGEAGRPPESRQPGIVIKPWDPKTPYLKELRAAEPQAAFEVYLSNRAEYGNSPAFYLDCADHFYKTHRLDLSLQVLSNLAEMELENPQVLRVLGHRLGQMRYFDLSVLTFEEVLRLRPEEPQSYRDLALALARRAEERSCTDLPALDPRTELDESADRVMPSGTPPPEPAPPPDPPENTPPRGVKHMTTEDARDVYRRVREDYARAIELLGKVVLGHWDSRFTEIELIALEELNWLIPRAKAAGVKQIPLDTPLIQLLDVDVRIVMTWHADNTDIDLWVIEPSGEKAFYSHNRTTIGGLVSQDFTGGYGPQEYMVRKAMPGVYTIKANYFGSRATRLLGAVTVQVDVFTNYGRENEDHRAITIQLKDEKETVTIGQIEF